MRLLHGSDEEKDLASSIMMDVLEKSMRMMHPFLSFVTEEIYQKLPNNKGMLILQSYPTVGDEFDFASDAALVSQLQEAVRIVRATRSKLSIAPEKKLHVVIRTGEGFAAKDVFIASKDMMATFMGAGTLEIDTDGSVDTSKAFPSSALGFEVFTFVREAIDVEAEIKKLENEIAKAEKNLEGSNRKLSNEQFVKNAKPEAIAKEKAKKAEFEEVIAKAGEHIALLRTL